jgi:pimeloyl-ACP methyl ester carboxylesterase
MTAKKCIGFLHGTGGHPSGTKGQWLSRSFELFGPHYTTDGDLDASVAQVADYWATRRESGAAEPELLVGSSYGGAVLWRLIERGIWTGPALFMAPAFVLAGPLGALTNALPPSYTAPMLIIHGFADDVVPFDDSLAFARMHSGCTLMGGHWGHRLQEVLEDGTLELALSRLLFDADLVPHGTT